MGKRFTVCRLDQYGISEWLDEADTRTEAEEKFHHQKSDLKPGQILVVAESATGHWMIRYPEHD